MAETRSGNPDDPVRIDGKFIILGWGSLIWDIEHQGAEKFYERVDCKKPEEWHTADGLKLPIEFSRVSSKCPRKKILTLVIDETQSDSLCPVKFAVSTRTALNEVIRDLRRREGTIRNRIGNWCKRSGLHELWESNEPARQIAEWADRSGCQGIVWTALESNYQCSDLVSPDHKPFSPENAADHLLRMRGEDETAFCKAVEYIAKAPVTTSLRRYLETQNWYTEARNDALISGRNSR